MRSFIIQISVSDLSLRGYQSQIKSSFKELDAFVSKLFESKVFSLRKALELVVFFLTVPRLTAIRSLYLPHSMATSNRHRFDVWVLYSKTLDG